jgi:hypothetical protein
MSNTLGDQLHLSAFTIRGNITVENCGELLSRIVDDIGMTLAHGSTVVSYPVEGKGGVGFTVFVPITESFLILDAWPQAKKPHAYLVIGSCKRFTDKAVINAILEAGYEVSDNLAQILFG